MKAKAKTTRRIPTLKPRERPKVQAATESERNALLREQLAAREARIGEQQREIERLTNLAYSNGQVAQRLRDRLVEQATHNRRLLAEKDALVRDRMALVGNARRMREQRDELIRFVHGPLIPLPSFHNDHVAMRRKYPLPPEGPASLFDGKGHERRPV